MSPSIWQILVIAVVVVLLFGRGKISSLMGDVAKGIKSFKRGMAEDIDEGTKAVEKQADDVVDVTPAKDKA
ncbi:MAG: twin-arginine translocase TatA/TatE family subunit [Pseudomonadota bacterium]